MLSGVHINNDKIHENKDFCKKVGYFRKFKMTWNDCWSYYVKENKTVSNGKFIMTTKSKGI